MLLRQASRIIPTNRRELIAERLDSLSMAKDITTTCPTLPSPTHDWMYSNPPHMRLHSLSPLLRSSCHPVPYPRPTR